MLGAARGAVLSAAPEVSWPELALVLTWVAYWPMQANWCLSRTPVEVQVADWEMETLAVQAACVVGIA